MNGKSSTFLILVLAAVALGCFAVKSYYDYQVTMFKHEHGMDTAQPADATQAGSTPAAVAAPVVPPPPVVAATPPAETVSALPAATSPVPAVVPPVAAAAAPPARDPELDKVRMELEALREENKIAQQKIEAMRAGSTGANSGAAQTGQAASGSTPEQVAADAEVEALRLQLANAPAVAQVVECNWDFDLVFINGGKDRNLQAEEKFAVRRGADIVGFVTVEEVEATHAVTKLTSRNAQSETALKPAPGDDVIKWPLF